MISNQFKYKLFGRFKGRKKNNLISFDDFEKFKVNIKHDINKVNYNILDIGSGSGENALHLSSLNPNSKIFTSEIFEDGNINLLNQINRNNIKNIRLFNGNVLEFLDIIIHFEVFDEIWIMFPDPWPKKRHNKRRLINDIFLKKIYSYQKNNGKLMISSDSQSYIQFIMKTIYEVKNFYLWKNQSVKEWTYNNLDLASTKFYKKAKKLNKKPIFIELHKI